MMKLITEQYSDHIDTLIENSETGKRFVIEGPFATYDMVNENRRVYPKHVMNEAMQKYIKEKVSAGRGFGELNHPQTPQVDFERVVMVIQNLQDNNKNHWIGKGTIINEGLGKIITAIMEAGGKVGVSTRALGEVKNINGVNTVQPGLRYSAIDVVSDPSGPGCFVNGIMESVNYEMLEDGTIIQLAVDSVKEKINEEKAIKAWAELMIKFGA